MTVDDALKKLALEDWLKTEMEKYVCFDLNHDSNNETFCNWGMEGLAVTPISTLLDPNGHEEAGKVIKKEPNFRNATDVLLEEKKKPLEITLEEQGFRKELLIKKVQGEEASVVQSEQPFDAQSFEIKLENEELPREVASTQALPEVPKEPSRNETLPGAKISTTTTKENSAELEADKMAEESTSTTPIDIVKLKKMTGKVPIMSLSKTKKMQEEIKANEALKKMDITEKALGDMPYKSLSRDNRLPDINDPNFNCCVCKKTFSGRYTYGFHLIQVHHIPDGIVFYKDVKSNNTELANIKVILFCPICNMNFKTYSIYKHHLLNFHTSQSPLTGRTGSNPYMMPDVHDQKFFCRTCQDHFDSKATYRYHLICVHSMAHDHVFTEQEEITSNGVHTCPSCQGTFRCYDDYLSHKKELGADQKYQCSTRKRQKEERQRKEKKRLALEERRAAVAEKKRRRAIIPEFDDPNFYCRSCGTTLTSKKQYVRHLKRVHQIEKSPAVKVETTPAVKLEFPGESNYCSICDIVLASKYQHRYHVRKMHCI